MLQNHNNSTPSIQERAFREKLAVHSDDNKDYCVILFAF
jgi:hypothetical protein